MDLEIRRNETWDRIIIRFKGADDGKFRDMTGVTIKAHARRTIDSPDIWFDLNPSWVDQKLGIARVQLSKEQTRHIDGPTHTDLSGVYDMDLSFERAGEIVRYTVMGGSISILKDVTRGSDEV